MARILLPIILITIFSCQQSDMIYTAVRGIYRCEENSVHSGYKKYLVEIEEVNNNPGQYIISNFHNLGDSEFLYATVRQDSIFIERQINGVLYFNGKGIISKHFNRIDWNYTTDNGITELDYYATFSR
jgi:hypothetical protein